MNFPFQNVSVMNVVPILMRVMLTMDSVDVYQTIKAEHATNVMMATMDFQIVEVHMQ